MKPLKTLLVGVDFSPCSGNALREAVRVAALQGADIRVLHVIASELAIDLESALRPMQSGIREGLVADVHKEWSRFSFQLGLDQKISFDVRIDHRLSGLIRAASESAADLLVLGAFGTVRPEVGTGTVATSCVRHAPCDVLLVRDTHVGPFKSIVAAVDFSDASARALRRAVEWAVQDHSQLHVIHDFDPPWNRLHYRAPTPQADPKFITAYTESLHRRLREFCRPALEHLPALSVHYSLTEGAAHRSEIAAYAQLKGADLICLGTRGSSNVRDFFLGSTAEKVLLLAPCSILAVRPDARSSE